MNLWFLAGMLYSLMQRALVQKIDPRLITLVLSPGSLPQSMYDAQEVMEALACSIRPVYGRLIIHKYFKDLH